MTEPVANFENIELFKGKALSDIFKDIYSNTKEKNKQIDILIKELQPLITNVADAIQLIPLIRDYLDLDVKNNEHLIKMAAVAQKIASKTTGGGGGLSGDDDYTIPESEINELRKLAIETTKNIPVATPINTDNNTAPNTLNLTSVTGSK
jgi:hypothetical protein